MPLFPVPKHFHCIFLLLISLTACQSAQSQNQKLQPLPQDTLVQVYFNHSQAGEYQEPYREKKRPGDNLEQHIIDTISQAQSTVDIAVQEFKLPKIAQALVAKQASGVKVRVILENTYNRSGSDFTPEELTKLTPREKARYQEFTKFIDINNDGKISPQEIQQRDALMILRQGKVPIIDDKKDGSRGSDLMHHKFVIVDNRYVIITSSNFTLSDIHGDFSNPSSLGNANNLVKIDSSEVAAIFTQEFNLMWGEKQANQNHSGSKFGLKKPQRSPQTISLGNNKITINFSPTSPTQPWIESSNGLIGENLKTASQSVDMALFVFSEQKLANILGSQQQKSVKIRALIEPQFAYRNYSEALDMMGVALGDKCRYELDNQPWKNPITTVGVPSLQPGDLLHHKFAVLDGKIVITGSHNWSEAANSSNDESVLIIENPTVAAHFHREFERLYQQAKLGVPQAIQAKSTQQQKQCGVIKSRTTQESFQIVNLNTATATELATLPGVGEKLAQKIIITRQQRKFTSLADVERVPGVGKKMLIKWGDRAKL
ncbi:DUF655 domain-containing protein [Calothrix sp. 336/3]|uniref:DUF655 domain-containing protein n=1 Tax=Calothrix sp. 336/3 TaxID=1337936 RepID=UPI0004E35510|nr:DUF655 domain-containing protein [Calothrix sp. 336/3]AKG21751.1 competence protein ComE [Calothrix sp. 336/3]